MWNTLIFFVFLLVFTCCDVFAQQYLWPTDASRWMTSSFAETRPRRMHAAIDIKTWNRTGYKVFAVRDGYIQRIRVSPFGYGKVIYQKLDTGETAIYAHLDKFTKKLDAFIVKEQEKNGRYRVDRYLSPTVFPVKQGEILGYSGETGIGVPHLHFEMRDAQNRPFNPLLKGFGIEDSVAPIPTGLAAIPLTHGMRVNGDFRPHRYTLQRVERNTYRIKETFSFEGEIGLAVKCYDKTDEGNNRFHVYKIDFFIDGQPHFSIKYDKFSYGHNRLVQLERDFRFERQGHGRYIHLFADPQNKLNFYRSFNTANGRLLAESRIATMQLDHPVTANAFLTPGQHTFRIELKDFFGNTSVISGDFVAGSWFKIRPEITVNDSIQLHGVNMPEDISADGLTIWERASVRKNSWMIKHALTNNGSNGAHTIADYLPVQLSPPGRSFAGKSFRFLATDENGVESWPAFFSTPQNGGGRALKIALHPEFYDDYLRVLLKANIPLKKMPFVEISNGDGSTLYPEIFQKDLSEYVFTTALHKLQGRNVRIVAQVESVNGHLTASEISFENQQIQQSNGGELASQDGQIRVVFGQRSLYKDLFGRIEIKQPLSPLSAVRDPKMQSHVYSVEPKDVPLNSGALVYMKYPDSLEINDPRQLGVYYRVGRGRWVFIDNKVDTIRKEISTKVFSLEDFVLRIDDTPPTVIIRSPGDNQTISSHKTIRVYAKDRESGFASEESLVLKIDGRKMIAEYDPENALVIYKPRKPFTPGAHLLEFTATDRCGNITHVKRSFTVARSPQGR